MFFLLIFLVFSLKGLSFAINTQHIQIGSQTFFISPHKTFIFYKSNFYPNREIFLSPNNYLEVLSQELSSSDFSISEDQTMRDTYFYKQWYLDFLKVPTSWPYSQGEGVIVAILDTGIDLEHQDLKSNIWKNKNEDWLDEETPGYNGLDDDGNGIIDDYYGYNAIENTGNVQDNNGHGTAIAGIISAACNNWGICGIAPRAIILPIKVLNQYGSGYISDVLKGISYALEIKKLSHLPMVFNLSWAIYDADEPLLEAIRALLEENIIFVNSAGNDHLNLENYPLYPACYNLKNVIVVTSVNQDGYLSTFANYGIEYVDIAAPGENIFTCDLNNNFKFISGTSFAAANVSGIAALLFSLSPHLLATQIKDLLWTSCIKKEELSSFIYQGCVANAYRSIYNLLSNNPGDINGDYEISIIDALLLARLILTSKESIDLLIGDVNCDTKIDIIDALLIARYALRLPLAGWCKQYSFSH